MVLNEQYYLKEEIVSLELLDVEGAKNVLPVTSENYPRAVELSKNVDTTTAKLVFRLDCIESTQLGTYANMWHIYALSSVLKQPIRSVYPQTNQRMRPAFHRVVKPRDGDLQHTPNRPITIMWTRTCPMTKDSSWWSPNHFVPCVAKQRDLPFIQVQNKVPHHVHFL